MSGRIGLVIATTGLSILACRGTDSGAPDVDATNASMSLAYSIATLPRESGRSDPPVIFIDGIAQPEFDVQYPTEMDAIDANHRVELRSGDTLLAAIDLRGADIEDCTYQRPLTGVTSFKEHICEFDSGDLRLGTPSGTIQVSNGTLGQCVIDGSASCGPECTDMTCGSGTHCTSIVVSHSPVYSHLGCAPIGTVAVGAPCTFSAGSSGDYDDCGNGSVCVSGTCRALCGASCGSCAPIDGEPGELSFCM